MAAPRPAAPAQLKKPSESVFGKRQAHGQARRRQDADQDEEDSSSDDDDQDDEEARRRLQLSHRLKFFLDGNRKAREEGRLGTWLESEDHDLLLLGTNAAILEGLQVQLQDHNDIKSQLRELLKKQNAGTFRCRATSRL